MSATGSPGTTITRGRPLLPSNIYRLQIDRLPAQHIVEIAFGTSLKVWEEHDISFDTGLWEGANMPPISLYFLDGSYQFNYRGIDVTQESFAPIAYSKTDRQMSFIEVRSNHGDWRPMIQSTFS